MTVEKLCEILHIKGLVTIYESPRCIVVNGYMYIKETKRILNPSGECIIYLG